MGLSGVKSRESPASRDKLVVQQTDMNGRMFFNVRKQLA